MELHACPSNAWCRCWRSSCCMSRPPLPDQRKHVLSIPSHWSSSPSLIRLQTSEHSTRQYCRLRKVSLNTTSGLLTLKGPPTPGAP
uniref:Uncharacterized protein n=1 Tax=Arundo donax TaxID=35708 RepID=A0A0A9A619_ARUDO